MIPRPAPLTLTQLMLLLAAVCTGLVVALTWLLQQTPWPAALTYPLTAVVTLVVSITVLLRLSRPLRQGLRGLEAGLLNFADQEFSTSLIPSGSPETQALAHSYNRAAEQLRQQRYSLHQRELLLDKVVQNSPMMVLLLDDRQRVVFANRVCEQFFGGPPLGGRPLADCLSPLSTDAKALFSSPQDGLFQVQASSNESYHRLSGRFQIHNKPHHLFLVRQITRELARQEAQAWKKVIRVISHELNNSLAPISSMSHSGKTLLDKHSDPRLTRVFNAIDERCQGLSDFIQGYARFAKLPEPRCQTVAINPFVANLRLHYEFQYCCPSTELEGQFDPVQLEQVLINLLKNAHESGSSPLQIELSVRTTPQGLVFSLSDAGPGMNHNVMQQALLPFYSTKKEGSGLGLALCHEIIDAHHGSLQLSNNDHGGLTVTLVLPHS
ncbi:sensor histidine kinase [Ferrimonas kyonanensis]|uniref:sensor histidine kinase n=1 Tax=Ferrimonas kyonanensis TaxID=364763 RepID=UPI0004086DC7|nr:ATP-binding protein [Ferrimonas kyonanensis]